MNNPTFEINDPLQPDSKPIEDGAQRLSGEQLRQWEALGYGMFVHFGMSTFVGEECPEGTYPASTYNPTELDVRQWVAVARDAGMRYMVLTAKHVSGHCLWPSTHTDYHVGNSGNTTDVVAAFVDACREMGILPGLYYCSWDNHHRFGSVTPTDLKTLYKERIWTEPGVSEFEAYSTSAYQEFQCAQIRELLTTYGPLVEFWMDIPGMMPRSVRDKIYKEAAEIHPGMLFMANNGIGDGIELRLKSAWPTDLIAIERSLPDPINGHGPWRRIEGDDYYLPGEVCEPIGRTWFWHPNDKPRSDSELLGMYLISRARNTNLLLNVPPDTSGKIPQAYITALQALRRNIDSFGG